MPSVRRPIDSAWDQVLSKSVPDREANAVARICNDTDYLDSRQFTVIHKIILGLSAKPLLPELIVKRDMVNAVDASGRTCLSWAAATKNHQHMQLLLEAGADPRIPDSEGNPPLFHAIRASDLDGVRTLVANGADLQRRDIFGGTVLHSASQAAEHPDLVQFLVWAGLPVDVVDSDGNPPLQYAAWRDLPQNVARLLDLGAVTTLADFGGDTVINIAIAHGADRVVEVLLDRGVALNRLNKRRQTPLHTAARAPRLSVFQLLSKADLSEVDAETVDADGKTFEDYFRQKAEMEDTALWDAFRMLVARSKKRFGDWEKAPLLMHYDGESVDDGSDVFEDAFETWQAPV